MAPGRRRPDPAAAASRSASPSRPGAGRRTTWSATGPASAYRQPAAHDRHRRDPADGQRREAEPGEEAVGVARAGVDATRRSARSRAPRRSRRPRATSALPAPAALVPVGDDGVAHVDGRNVDQGVGRGDGQQRHAEGLRRRRRRRRPGAAPGRPAPRGSAARARRARCAGPPRGRPTSSAEASTTSRSSSPRATSAGTSSASQARTPQRRSRATDSSLRIGGPVRRSAAHVGHPARAGRSRRAGWASPGHRHLGSPRTRDSSAAPARRDSPTDTVADGQEHRSSGRGAGTLLNMATILLGSGLGVLLGGRLPERTRRTVTDALGPGHAGHRRAQRRGAGRPRVRDAVGDGGTAARRARGPADRRHHRLACSARGPARARRRAGCSAGCRRSGASAEPRRASSRGTSAPRSSSSSGPWRCSGSLSDGLGRGIEQLALKSTLDGFASLAFAASLGWGVAASALVGRRRPGRC